MTSTQIEKLRRDFLSQFGLKYGRKSKPDSLYDRGGTVVLGFMFYQKINDDGEPTDVFDFRLPEGIDSSPMKHLLPKLEETMKKILDSRKIAFDETTDEETVGSTYIAEVCFYFKREKK